MMKIIFIHISISQVSKNIKDDELTSKLIKISLLTPNLGKSIEIAVDRGVPNPFAKSWEQNFEYNQNKVIDVIANEFK